MKRLLFGGMLVVLNLGFSYAYLEPALSVCKAKDPNIDKCIIDVIERIRPNIASGSYGSERQHPKIEPVVVERISIERGPSFSANFSDLVIAGSSKFIIKKLKADLSQKQINVSVILPVLNVTGKYVLNMNILVLRISGKGDIRAQLNDTKAILRLKYFTESVDGKDLVRFRPIDLKIKFDKASFYLKNLFNGDPMLEKVGNDAINENPHVLLDEVKSSFEEGLSEQFTATANSLVKQSELKEIFPDWKWHVSFSMRLTIKISCTAPILTACARDDPKFEKCVKEVVERIRSNIAVGNYGEGQPLAPPLEPIFIDRMHIDHGPSFQATLSNVTIKGSGDFSIRRVRLGIDDKMMNVSVKLPIMLVNGQYSLDMRLLLLRITGQGDFDLLLNNTIANMRLKYHLVPGEDGQEKVQMYPIQVKLRFDKGQFNLHNLFNGDPELGQIGNSIINENPLILLEEAKPAFEEALGRIFSEMANSAISGATELDIFPL
ncbi:uncharacterized protein LOC131679390 [Topomyia yanbarensis]|uniref:uncharacterized protein LOC131679390 n=1 Tax=Topomyia yanbarensis TaxID=2498891 RepID=UPI00273B5C6E|nr:uncharacterized protein LOC131679390 [Topomyia yanbarensis]